MSAGTEKQRNSRDSELERKVQYGNSTIILPNVAQDLRARHSRIDSPKPVALEPCAIAVEHMKTISVLHRKVLDGRSILIVRRVAPVSYSCRGAGNVNPSRAMFSLCVGEVVH